MKFELGNANEIKRKKGKSTRGSLEVQLVMRGHLGHKLEVKVMETRGIKETLKFYTQITEDNNINKNKKVTKSQEFKEKN